MKNTTTSSVPARGPADHEVRDQIVAAATEHFSRYGYEKTTVSDLARAIGFSKAYIYKFFESKQAIGEMICVNCLREIESEVRTAVAETDLPPEKLRRIFKVFTEASLRLFFRTASYTKSQHRPPRKTGRRCKPMRHVFRSCSRKFCRKVAKAETSNARRRWTKPRWQSIWCCARTSTRYSCSTTATPPMSRLRSCPAWFSEVCRPDAINTSDY
jgi:Transcriptional regulator